MLSSSWTFDGHAPDNCDDATLEHGVSPVRTYQTAHGPAPGYGRLAAWNMQRCRNPRPRMQVQRHEAGLDDRARQRTCCPQPLAATALATLHPRINNAHNAGTLLPSCMSRRKAAKCRPCRRRNGNDGGPRTRRLEMVLRQLQSKVPQQGQIVCTSTIALRWTMRLIHTYGLKLHFMLPV